jgi:hypothetical protein
LNADMSDYPLRVLATQLATHACVAPQGTPAAGDATNPAKCGAAGRLCLRAL